MSLVAKLLCIFFLLAGGGSTYARDIHILVLGGGADANCHLHSFGVETGIFQLGLDGAEKPASPALDGANCKGGSAWIPLGQALIQQGMAQKVVFMPIALPNTRARDWGPGGRSETLLKHAIGIANARRIVFDYAFWQQGFADRGTDEAVYRNDLRNVIRSISLKIKVDKWLVAQSGGCVPGGARKIAAVQQEAGMAHSLNRFAGPNFSELTAAEVLDGCIYTASGQRRVAQLWLASMVKADVDDRKYQKESLLYYFK